MTNPAASAFTSAQYEEGYPEGYEKNYWHKARERILLRAIGATIPKETVLLEIGCGPGHYVGALLRRGYQAFGCELATPRVIASVRERITIGTDFKSLTMELRQQIGGVLLLDVIEHIADDKGFLEDILVALPNLKYFVVAVPAGPEIWSNYDIHYGHYRRYTERSLRELLQSLGIAPVRLQYAFHALYFVARLLLRAQKSRSVNIAAPRHAWAHKIIGKLFDWEAVLMPKRLIGSSLICIGHTPASRSLRGN
jgi:SAM-dependent methyltransferase